MAASAIVQVREDGEDEEMERVETALDRALADREGKDNDEESLSRDRAAGFRNVHVPEGGVLASSLHDQRVQIPKAVKERPYIPTDVAKAAVQALNEQISRLRQQHAEEVRLLRSKALDVRKEAEKHYTSYVSEVRKRARERLTAAEAAVGRARAEKDAAEKRASEVAAKAAEEREEAVRASEKRVSEARSALLEAVRVAEAAEANERRAAQAVAVARAAATDARAHAQFSKEEAARLKASEEAHRLKLEGELSEARKSLEEAQQRLSEDEKALETERKARESDRSAFESEKSQLTEQNRKAVEEEVAKAKRSMTELASVEEQSSKPGTKEADAGTQNIASRDVVEDDSKKVSSGRVAFRKRIEELERELEEAQLALTDGNSRAVSIQNEADEAAKRHKASKGEIKQWLEEYEKEHGVKPDEKAKEAIKDKYEAYAHASTEAKRLRSEADDATAALEPLEQRVRDLERELAALREAGPGGDDDEGTRSGNPSGWRNEEAEEELKQARAKIAELEKKLAQASKGDKALERAREAEKEAERLQGLLREAELRLELATAEAKAAKSAPTRDYEDDDNDEEAENAVMMMEEGSLEELVAETKEAVAKAKALWADKKKNECLKLLQEQATRLRNALPAIRQAKPGASAALRPPIVETLRDASDLPEGKAAVALRSGLDTFLEDAPEFIISKSRPKHTEKDEKGPEPEQDDAAKREIEDLRAKLRQAQEANAKKQQEQDNDDNDDNDDDAKKEDEDEDQDQDQDQEQDSAEKDDDDDNGDDDGDDDEEEEGGEERTSRKSRATTPSTTRSGGGTTSKSTGLQKKLKTAEAKVTKLETQLSRVKAELEEAKKSGGGRSTRAGAATGGGASATEVAKLRKEADKAKTLKKQLDETRVKLRKAETAAAAAASDASAKDAERKAAAAERKLAQEQKKWDKEKADLTKSLERDIELANRKVAKLEEERDKLSAELEERTKERDELKKQAAEAGELSKEMDKLKEEADRAKAMDKEVRDAKKEVEELTTLYKKEQVLRKQYWNMMEDMRGKIRVFCRCRPMSSSEKERGCESVVQFPDGFTIELATAKGPKQYIYDQAFGPDSTQEQVFEDTERLIQSAFDGYNVCIFAYGQTGSGKTFTMSGSPEMPGVTPRAINRLFDSIAENEGVCEVKISCYFVELYNDKLQDLFWRVDHGKKKSETAPRLDVKKDAKGMVWVRGAVSKDASSASELLRLFDEGNSMRAVGSTKMNADSSRSHSIFSIIIENYNKQTKKTARGKLSLVDLAGSERVSKTGASADRLREAQSINKSLSALGNVISALSTSESHVPYRDNLLTLLMSDSLGGNAKTLMFVNLSPADYNVEETQTSLVYASRVKLITNNAEKSQESAEVARLKKIIARLKKGEAADIEDAELENDDDDDEGAAKGGGGATPASSK